MKKFMKSTATALIASLFTVAGASAAPLADATPNAQSDAQTVLLQKIRSVTLRNQDHLNRLVLATAEARVQTKIDNMQFDKKSIPAFAMLSAFTID